MCESTLSQSTRLSRHGATTKVPYLSLGRLAFAVERVERLRIVRIMTSNDGRVAKTAKDESQCTMFVFEPNEMFTGH